MFVSNGEGWGGLAAASTIVSLATRPLPSASSSNSPKNFSGTTEVKIEGGRPPEKDVKRWTKGDLTGGDPVALPVDPKSMASLTGEVFVGRLSKALYFASAHCDHSCCICFQSRP